MSRKRTRRHGLFGGLLALAMVLALLPATAGAEQADDPGEPIVTDGKDEVTLAVPDQNTLIAVVDGGYDLAENVEQSGDGFLLTAFVTESEVAELEALGVGVELERTAAQLEDQREELMEERQETLDEQEALALALELEDTDTVVVGRADYFTTTGGSRQLSVEAKTTDGTSPAGANPTMTLEFDAGPGTEIGDGGSTTMSAFIDSGQYMYHRTQINLSGVTALTVDAPSSAAGSYSAVPAQFGPTPTEAGLTGSIALVDDGTALPTEGCFPLVGFPAGAIALVDRGNCPFVDKVNNAQAAGAVAVIVANNLDGAPFAMSGSCGACTIPAVMISLGDGATLKAGLPASGKLSTEPLATPTRVRVTSANGGSAERDVEQWLGQGGTPTANRYFKGFLDHYPDAYELDEIMDELHAQYPDLTEIIELPFLTNGYQRNAQRTLGATTNAAVGVDSHAWGHEGGNDLSIGFVDPGVADSPLSVVVAGNVITVNLGTNAEGALVSTAAQVVAAINADAAASALVLAYTYRGNAGAGVVQPAALANLTDGLDAPDHVERAPYQVRMLRIGKVRDGSKTGVLAYSQEHAREWQTPLVGVETASRLLHNYNVDHKTKQLVDNLDMFFIFSTNPDGQLYSYYDFGSQRRNMKRYCGVGQNNDFGARDTWGVDNNRNYTAYNGEQGYSGASTSCTSDTFRGPFALSEAESANIHWVPGAFPNIKYSMNIHSSGNYFMWAPGAYIASGRISAPRPSFGTENYFYVASEQILSAIQDHRGLAVTPARTGPIADVLYSAAGNSGDMMYYDFGIFGWSFEVGTSFQPSWGGGQGEAYDQMMEFSNGLVEMMHVALDWTRDRYAPSSWINEDVSGPFDGPVGITFGTSEAADIYYTLDGSNPTTSSAQYQPAGIREDGETITITETTTIKWYSVDMAGNVEAKYSPSRNNPRTATIVIND